MYGLHVLPYCAACISYRSFPNRTLLWTVSNGTGSVADVTAGSAAQWKDGEDPVDVIEASRHHSSWRVRQVEGVAQLVQRRSKTRRIVGPVELTTGNNSHRK